MDIQNSYNNEPSRKKSAININNKYELNLSSSKEKSNLKKMTISPKKLPQKKYSPLTKKKSENSENDSFVKNIIIDSAKSKRKSRYPFILKPKMVNGEHSLSNSKMNSCELFQKSTKQLYRKYNLENELYSNTNKSYQNPIIYPNCSYVQIGNHLKQTIIIMKKQIQSQNKNNFKRIRNSQSNCCLNNLKGLKRQKESIFLLTKEETTKKNKSFSFTEQSGKKLRKRIKNEINERIKAVKSLKRVSEILESDSDEDHNYTKNKIIKNISLSPNSYFIFFFDLLIIVSNIYCIIFIPLNLAQNENIFERQSNYKEIIKYLTECIYLLDFIIGFFRGYFNYEMEIVRDNKKILIHYLKQDFFMDLLEGIPIYSLIRIININFKYNYSLIFDQKIFFIKILLFIKSFKIFKIMTKKKNKALEDFYRYLSVYYYLEKIVMFMISFIIFLLFIHLFICLHIFFAVQKFPNWITYRNY